VAHSLQGIHCSLVRVEFVFRSQHDNNDNNNNTFRCVTHLLLLLRLARSVDARLVRPYERSCCLGSDLGPRIGPFAPSEARVECTPSGLPPENMSTVPTQYPSPLPIRSAIFKKPPDGVPSVEELEGLQAELKLLKQRTLERARKAGEDMRMIDESMRRIKEREKGKAKAIDKVKIERGCTWSVVNTISMLTVENPRYSTSLVVLMACSDMALRVPFPFNALDNIHTCQCNKIVNSEQRLSCSWSTGTCNHVSHMCLRPNCTNFMNMFRMMSNSHSSAGWRQLLLHGPLSTSKPSNTTPISVIHLQHTLSFTTSPGIPQIVCQIPLNIHQYLTTSFSFDDNKKKKKRKRDIVDSEGEPGQLRFGPH
jgi:hypothetical protein